MVQVVPVGTITNPVLAAAANRAAAVAWFWTVIAVDAPVVAFVTGAVIRLLKDAETLNWSESELATSPRPLKAAALTDPPMSAWSSKPTPVNAVPLWGVNWTFTVQYCPPLIDLPTQSLAPGSPATTTTKLASAVFIAPRPVVEVGAVPAAIPSQK